MLDLLRVPPRSEGPLTFAPTVGDVEGDPEDALLSAASGVGLRQLAEALVGEGHADALLPLLEAAGPGGGGAYWDPEKHPRWPKGTPLAGQFMRVGQRFELHGVQYDVEAVLPGKIHARVATKGDVAGAKSIDLDVKTLEKVTRPQAEKVTAATPGEIQTTGKAGTATVIDPHVDHGSHDASIPIPKAAVGHVTPEQWKRFGKLDQERYSQLMERYGTWAPGKAQSLVTAAKKGADKEVLHAVEQGYSSQYGSSSGLSIGLHQLAHKIAAAITGGDSAEKARSHFEDGRALQHELASAIQWDLYNRSRAPDVALFHMSNAGRAQQPWSSVLKGQKPVFSGLSMSQHYGANFGFGDNVFAAPVAVRHVVLATISADVVSHHFQGEKEIAMADPFVVDPKRATMWASHELTSGQASWLSSQTKGAAGGETLAKLLDNINGGEPLPIPPAQAEILMDGAGGKAWKEPPPAAWSMAQAFGTKQGADGSQVPNLKWAKADKSGNPEPLKAAELRLTPGDFIQGNPGSPEKGTVYVIVSDPTDTYMGLAYYKLTEADGVTPASPGQAYHFEGGGSTMFKKIDSHFDMEAHEKAAAAKAGVQVFHPEAWTESGDQKLIGDLPAGTKFKVHGQVWQVEAKLSSAQSSIRLAETGQTAKINNDYKTPWLQLKPGYSETGAQAVDPADFFEGEPRPLSEHDPKPGDVFRVHGGLWEVTSVSGGPEKAVEAKFVGPGTDGETEIFAKETPAARLEPKPLGWEAPQPGDVLALDGKKGVVTKVLKDGTVQVNLKPGVVKLAPNDPRLAGIFAADKHELGEKAKLRDLQPGDKFHAGTGQKLRPYMVVSQKDKKTTVVRSLDTGEEMPLSSGKSFQQLVAKAAPGLEPPAGHGVEADLEQVFDPHAWRKQDTNTPMGDLVPGDVFSLIGGGGPMKVLSLEGIGLVLNLGTGDEVAISSSPEALAATLKNKQVTKWEPKGTHAPEAPAAGPQPLSSLAPGDHFLYGASLYKVESHAGKTTKASSVLSGTTTVWANDEPVVPVPAPKAAAGPGGFEVGSYVHVAKKTMKDATVFKIVSFLDDGSANAEVVKPGEGTGSAPGEVHNLVGLAEPGKWLAIDAQDLGGAPGAPVGDIAAMHPPTPNPEGKTFVELGLEPGDRVYWFGKPWVVTKVHGTPGTSGHVYDAVTPDGEFSTYGTQGKPDAYTKFPVVAPEDIKVGDHITKAGGGFTGQAKSAVFEVVAVHGGGKFDGKVVEPYAEGGKLGGEGPGGVLKDIGSAGTTWKKIGGGDAVHGVSAEPDAPAEANLPSGPPAEMPATAYDPAAYVSVGQSTLAQMGVGDIFVGAKNGKHYLVTKTGAPSGLTALDLQTGKTSTPWKYDKVAEHLQHKSKAGEVAHDQLAPGDAAQLGHLEPGDQFKYAGHVLQVVSAAPKVEAGNVTVAPVGADLELGQPFSLGTSPLLQVTFHAHAADAEASKAQLAASKVQTPAEGIASAGGLPDAEGSGLAAFSPKSKSGGGYVFSKAKLAGEGTLLQGKDGATWKVAQAGPEPVLTDGKAHFKVDPDANLKVVDVPFDDQAPPLGTSAGQAQELAATAGLHPAPFGATIESLGLTPGATFTSMGFGKTAGTWVVLGDAGPGMVAAAKVGGTETAGFSTGQKVSAFKPALAVGDAVSPSQLSAGDHVQAKSGWVYEVLDAEPAAGGSTLTLKVIAKASGTSPLLTETYAPTWYKDELGASNGWTVADAPAQPAAGGEADLGSLSIGDHFQFEGGGGQTFRLTGFADGAATYVNLDGEPMGDAGQAMKVKKVPGPAPAAAAAAPAWPTYTADDAYALDPAQFVETGDKAFPKDMPEGTVFKHDGYLWRVTGKEGTAVYAHRMVGGGGVPNEKLTSVVKGKKLPVMEHQASLAAGEVPVGSFVELPAGAGIPEGHTWEVLDPGQGEILYDGAPATISHPVWVQDQETGKVEWVGPAFSAKVVSQPEDPFADGDVVPYGGGQGEGWKALADHALAPGSEFETIDGEKWSVRALADGGGVHAQNIATGGKFTFPGDEEVHDLSAPEPAGGGFEEAGKGKLSELAPGDHFKSPSSGTTFEVVKGDGGSYTVKNVETGVETAGVSPVMPVVKLKAKEWQPSGDPAAHPSPLPLGHVANTAGGTVGELPDATEFSDGGTVWKTLGSFDPSGAVEAVAVGGAMPQGVEHSFHPDFVPATTEAGAWHVEEPPPPALPPGTKVADLSELAPGTLVKTVTGGVYQVRSVGPTPMDTHVEVAMKMVAPGEAGSAGDVGKTFTSDWIKSGAGKPTWTVVDPADYVGQATSAGQPQPVATAQMEVGRWYVGAPHMDPGEFPTDASGEMVPFRVLSYDQHAGGYEVVDANGEQDYVEFSAADLVVLPQPDLDKVDAMNAPAGQHPSGGAVAGTELRPGQWYEDSSGHQFKVEGEGDGTYWLISDQYGDDSIGKDDDEFYVPVEGPSGLDEPPDGGGTAASPLYPGDAFKPFSPKSKTGGGYHFGLLGSIPDGTTFTDKTGGTFTKVGHFGFSAMYRDENGVHYAADPKSKVKLHAPLGGGAPSVGKLKEVEAAAAKSGSKWQDVLPHVGDDHSYWTTPHAPDGTVAFHAVSALKPGQVFETADGTAYGVVAHAGGKALVESMANPGAYAAVPHLSAGGGARYVRAIT